jgi:hypothetical protein
MDLQQVWTNTPSHFKAYALVIPTGRKWLVSLCSKIPVEDHIVLPISDTLTRITNETRQVPGPRKCLPPKDPNDDEEDEEDEQDEPEEEEPAVIREPDEC